MNKRVDVIIVGAGAAGLMCAIEAGKRGRSGVVLEHNDSIGKKIRISGGGRCNFTNIHATPENFLSQNPHFAKSALARYTSDDFCALVQKYKIAFHEKKLGQLFCDKSAQEIIDLLKNECDRNSVEILLGIKVSGVEKKDTFQITTSRGRFESASLVIATGGLSIPPLGATDFGYKIAKQFDIHVNTPYPGLVPFTLAGKDLHLFQELSGISVDAIVSIGAVSFRENILFTHKGLSGPAILQISSYWQKGQPIHLNLLPDHDIFSLFKDRLAEKIHLKNLLKEYLPARLTEILCKHFISDKPINQYSVQELQKISHLLHRFALIPNGTEGYAKAEVTVGGVNTDELSSKTMEAKKISGLYFIGEVVDVTGHLGGFNFQWAWASGFAAGQFV